MADINSIRVGQLPNEVISLTDKIPHEVGDDLKRATIEDLAIFISNYASTIIGVGFRAVTVLDGQTLPETDKQEFILVGSGTFYNVNGGSTIVLTEELNALISNGAFWTIGVEIPVNIQSVITQSVRDGFTNTSPSEDAIYNYLLSYAKLSDLPSPIKEVIEVANVPSLPLTGEAGKIYVVKDLNKIYRWNSTFYQELAYTDISGKADLDINGKVPLSQINDALLGSVNYKGTYNASTNSPTLPTVSSANKGWYYVVSTAGTQQSINFVAGDWIISNGTSWGKVDNNNNVTSVAGKVGAVTLVKADVGLSNVDNTSDVNKPISTATQTALNGKFDKTGGTISGNVTFTGTQNIINGKTGFGISTPTSQVDIATGNASVLTDNLTLRSNSLEAGTEVGIFFSPSSAAGNIRGARISSANDGSNNIDLRFYTGIGAFITRKLTIFNTGGVSIGNTVDPGGSNLSVSGIVTASPATLDSQLPTLGQVKGITDLKAPLTSPALTGTPTAPTATAGTNTTQIATTAFVQANSRPYKVYTALISQTGTSAPTAVVLENTLGTTITWSRTSTGTYGFALGTGLWLASKTAHLFNIGITSAGYANSSINIVNGNILSVLSTYLSGVSTDGVMANCTIEIRVYN